MDWDALLHPVGPLPASTYWMRRIVVLGGFLVVLILIIVFATGGSSTPKPKATAKTDPGIVLPTSVPSSAKASASASASPTDDGGTGPTCTDAQLAISVDTVAQRYPDGSLPQFVVTVTNTSSTTCRRDVGADARTLTVTSGNDRIWSSADCGTKAKDVRTLTPGQKITLNSSWNRQRSLPNCSQDTPAGLNATVGVYVVKLQIGTLGPTQGASFNLS